jgi:glycogen(starch) synthase
MYNFVQLTRRERIILRNTVESYAENFDWSNLAVNYEKAYQLALQGVAGDVKRKS